MLDFALSLEKLNPSICVKCAQNLLDYANLYPEGTPNSCEGKLTDSVSFIEKNCYA